MYNTLSLFSFLFFLKKKVYFKIDHNPFEDKYDENLVTIHYISFIFSEMYQIKIINMRSECPILHNIIRN